MSIRSFADPFLMASQDKMPFPLIAEIVEMIVDDAWRSYPHVRARPPPSDLVRLATVSRAFVEPVRRNLYRRVRVNGAERFYFLVGRLEVCPHLAEYVQQVNLRSTCEVERSRDEAYGGFDVGPQALRMLLQACPNLYAIDATGPDFLEGLKDASVVKAAPRIRQLHLQACSHGEPCLHRGGIYRHASILHQVSQWPSLQRIGLSGLPLNRRSLEGLPQGASSITEMAIVSRDQVTGPHLSLLLHAPRVLRKLHLEFQLSPNHLASLLTHLGPTLVELVLCTTNNSVPAVWLLGLVPLKVLETLTLKGGSFADLVPVEIPPTVRRLSLSGTSVTAGGVMRYLQSLPDEPVLKRLSYDARGRSRGLALPASVWGTPSEFDRIHDFCREKGISWDYVPPEPDQ